MVLFNNIQVGQLVDVLMPNNMIELAKVRFKGSINGRKGDWVGLELGNKVGNSDGMIAGRRYFIVQNSFGFFTTADKIRFIQIKRSLYDPYKKVEVDTDEELFRGSEPNRPTTGSTRSDLKSVHISNEYHRRCQMTGGPMTDTDQDDTPSNHRLSHLIGRTRTIEEPPEDSLQKQPRYRPIYRLSLEETKWDGFFSHPPRFLTPASMPDYFLLRQKLQKHLSSATATRTHTPKTHNHPQMRDHLHDGWWNDVSL